MTFSSCPILAIGHTRANKQGMVHSSVPMKFIQTGTQNASVPIIHDITNFQDLLCFSDMFKEQPGLNELALCVCRKQLKDVPWYAKSA